MAWFSKPAAVEAPPIGLSDQLVAVEGAYRAAEREYDEACKKYRQWSTRQEPSFSVKVGTETYIQTRRPNGEGQRILSEVRRTKAQFMILMQRRAELRQEIGLIH